MRNNNKTKDAIRLFKESETIIAGCYIEKYLKNQFGVDISKLTKNHRLKYHPNFSCSFSNNKTEPAILSKIIDPDNKLVGYYVYFIKLGLGMPIMRGTSLGVVLIGEADAEEIIMVEDFIVGLRIAQHEGKTTAIFIEPQNLKSWYPKIGKIKKIELFCENETRFKQLRHIGGKIKEYWEGINVEIGFRQLQKVDINCKYLPNIAPKSPSLDINKYNNKNTGSHKCKQMTIDY